MYTNGRLQDLRIRRGFIRRKKKMYTPICQAIFGCFYAKISFFFIKGVRTTSAPTPGFEFATDLSLYWHLHNPFEFHLHCSPINLDKG